VDAARQFPVDLQDLPAGLRGPGDGQRAAVPRVSMSRRHRQPGGAGWGGAPAALARQARGRMPTGRGRRRAGDASQSPLLIRLPGSLGQHRPEASCESPAASNPEGTAAAAVPVAPGRAGGRDCCVRSRHRQKPGHGGRQPGHDRGQPGQACGRRKPAGDGPVAAGEAQPAEQAERVGEVSPPGGGRELLMTLIRTQPHAPQTAFPWSDECQAASTVEHGAPRVPAGVPAVEQTVRAWHAAGRSQRAIARELGIDRRKIKRMIDRPT
jgi:hypothetical protein